MAMVVMVVMLIVGKVLEMEMVAGNLLGMGTVMVMIWASQ